MNFLPIINDVFSTLLVLACWILAHQNAGGCEPFTRAISAGYGALAMLAMGSMLFRHMPELIWIAPYLVLGSKGVLALTLLGVSARLGRLYRE